MKKIIDFNKKARIISYSSASLALMVALMACNTTPAAAPEGYENGVLTPWTSSLLISTAEVPALIKGYLSDQQWISAYTGHGQLMKNAAPNGTKIKLDGVVYEKGLGAHANSGIKYKLNGSCSYITTKFGIDDTIPSSNKMASVGYAVVFTDQNGQKNTALSGGTSYASSGATILGFTVPATAVTLELIANDAGNNNWYDHAVWADAKCVDLPMPTPRYGPQLPSAKPVVTPPAPVVTPPAPVVTSKPFPANSGVIWDAEDFNSTEGVGYHDNTPGDVGGYYRVTENVDVERIQNEYGSAVTQIETGEWLKYIVTLPTAGNYAVNFRLAATKGAFDVFVDGNLVSQNSYIGTSANLSQYTIQKVINGIYLGAGRHSIKVVFNNTNKSINFDAMQFVKQ